MNPSPHAALVGRDDDLRRLSDLLATHRRCGLVGAPGVGKSALAASWAAQHDARWCSLAEQSSLDGALAAVLIALGELPGEGDAGQLAQRLARRLEQPVRLVIDQADHLIAPLWTALPASQATVLVTSRVAPPAPAPLLQLDPLSPAHAAALWASLSATPLPEPLRDLLDGNPFVIALASARARLLPASRLPDALQRDKTLHAAILRSWELLEPASQHALAHLAALPHQLDFDAAEAVVGLDALTQLADASLLRVDPLASTTQLPASVRAFARAHAPDLLDDGLRRFGGWLLAQSAGWPERLDADPDRLAWLDRQLPALLTLLASPHLHPDAACCAFILAARILTERGPHRALEPGLAALEPIAPASRWGAELLLAAARHHQRAGRPAAAQAALSRVEPLVSLDPTLPPRLSYTRGVITYELNDHAAAEVAWQATLLADPATVPHTFAHALLRLNMCRADLLDLHAPRALALFQEQGDLYGECLARSHLAEAERRAGRLATCCLELDRILQINQRLGSRTLEAYTTLQRSRALRVAQPQQAGPLLAQAAALYEQIGDTWGACIAYIDAASLHVDLAALDDAWAALHDAERAATTLARPYLLRACQAVRARWELACAVASPEQATAYTASAQQRADQLDADCPLPQEYPYTRRLRLRLAKALSGAPRVRICRDGDWIDPPDSPRAPLAHRAALRRIVAALATASAPLDLEALWAAGWPGERASAESVRNRVHVALNTLRKLGLQDALVNDDAGWSLDPARVTIVTPRA